jgi:hypothetical protein
MEGEDPENLRSEFVMEIRHPDAHFWRDVPQGDPRRNGPWTPEENYLFLTRLQEVRGNEDTIPESWGLFALGIPGRTRYQCSQHYRDLVNRGQLTDTPHLHLPSTPPPPDPDPDDPLPLPLRIYRIPIPQSSTASDLGLAERRPSRPIFEEEPRPRSRNPFDDSDDPHQIDDDAEDAEVIARLEARPPLMVPVPGAPFMVPVPAGPFIVPIPPATAPAVKTRKRLTTLEMIAIIRGHDSHKSFQQISNELGRSESGCRDFFDRWITTGELRAPWGRPKVGDIATAAVIDATLADRRSTVVQAGQAASISRETARRIRHREGYHYYLCIPIPRLTDHAKSTRVAFAGWEVRNPDSRVIIFTDESMVAQDLNMGVSGGEGEKSSKKELTSKTITLFQ